MEIKLPRRRVTVNGNRAFSDTEEALILAALQSGMRAAVVAAKTGVTTQAIYNAKYRALKRRYAEIADTLNESGKNA